MTGFHCKYEDRDQCAVQTIPAAAGEQETRQKSLEILRFLGLEQVQDLEAAQKHPMSVGDRPRAGDFPKLLDQPAAGMNSRTCSWCATIRKIRTVHHLAVLWLEHDT